MPCGKCGKKTPSEAQRIRMEKRLEARRVREQLGGKRPEPKAAELRRVR